jgi:hypothetical protein
MLDKAAVCQPEQQESLERPTYFLPVCFTDPLEHLAQAGFLKLIQQRYHGAGEDLFQRGSLLAMPRGVDIGSVEERAGLHCLVNIRQRDRFRRFQQS